MKNEHLKMVVVVVLLVICFMCMGALSHSQVKHNPVKTHAKAQAKNGLRAKVAAGPSVSLSCTPATSGTIATGFNFYRSTSSTGPFTILGTSPMSASCAYIDSTVAFSTTYYYEATGTVGASCAGGAA